MSPWFAMLPIIFRPPLAAGSESGALILIIDNGVLL